MKVITRTNVAPEHCIVIGGVDGGELLEHLVVGRSRVKSLYPVLSAVVEGIAGHYGAPVKVTRQDKRVLYNPRHNSQGLGFSTSQQ